MKLRTSQTERTRNRVAALMVFGTCLPTYSPAATTESTLASSSLSAGMKAA